jgi:hypothetical protein
VANPNISPGTLNLLLTSVSIPGFPALNLTPSVMGKAMARLTLEGEMTRHLPVAVGVVTSPQIYMIATLSVDINKAMNVAALFKAQWESGTVLGPVTVRTDSSTLPAFDLSQVGIVNGDGMDFNGDKPDITVMLRGQYPINSSLWP